MKLPMYAETEIDLPAMGAWPAGRHRFDERQIAALRAAEAAGRPLLIRGEPGTGKSQLAHAAAAATDRLLLSVVVDNRSEASDLQWRFDAIARLSDAQLVSAAGGTTRQDLDPSGYVEPGPLWWAFDWDSAREQAISARIRCTQPFMPLGWTPARGTVLLIDEIDKAEADVPNGLLEALGHWRFKVPALGRVIGLPDNIPPPLIVVTTNDERELPAPFLRRCLVLTLALPPERAALTAHMADIGRLHFPAFHALHPKVFESAAEMLADDRDRAVESGVYKPGLSEFLDLMRVLERVGGDPRENLEKLREYVFRKQPAA